MPETGKRHDPFIAFCFEIRVTDRALGGFSDCSGLQLETEFYEYNEGGENMYVHKLPTRTKQSNITLKRGIIGAELWDWYWELVTGFVQPKPISIVLHDPDRSREFEWQLIDALPCKWVGPELNAGQNNVATESLELCYRIIKRG